MNSQEHPFRYLSDKNDIKKSSNIFAAFFIHIVYYLKSTIHYIKPYRLFWMLA